MKQNRKIEAMHERFGSCDELCGTCTNLHRFKENRTYFKCSIYGITSSESSDWRISWKACGMYGKNYSGIQVMEILKHEPRKTQDEPINGQISMND